ncbi:hypothetical protein SVAN01_03040 [Stagonosporopsis vannaccii]|nr:hypothetical protein SVAN01_03040 [Stagonosporopsis vannaccii]
MTAVDWLESGAFGAGAVPLWGRLISSSRDVTLGSAEREPPRLKRPSAATSAAMLTEKCDLELPRQVWYDTAKH